MSADRPVPSDPATYFDGPDDWRTWLEDHHDTAQEIWLGFWKKHTGHPGLTYQDAVEQALCFGWIDGLLNRVDQDRHRIRFTPRRSGSSWSRVNVDRVVDLERRGLMTEAGRAAHEAGKTDPRGVYSYENGEPVELDPVYATRLAASPTAVAFLESTRPSYRRGVTGWVMSAKRPQTRDARMSRLIELSERQELVPAFYYERNKNPR